MRKRTNSASLENVKPERFGTSVGASTSIVEIPINKIKVGKAHRAYSTEALESLTQSIAREGLKTPLQVATRLGGFSLVAGRHRLEALKALGRKTAPCTVLDHNAAHIWGCTENLMRLELTALERAHARCEWALQMEKLCTPDRISSKPGRPKKGDVQFAISNPAFGSTEGARRKALNRDKKIVGLPQDVKDEIVKAKLDNEPSTIARIAACESREDQLAVIRTVARQRANKDSIRKRPAAQSKSSRSGMVQAQEELTAGVSALARAYKGSAFQKAWDKASLWDRFEFAEQYLKLERSLYEDADWEDDVPDNRSDEEFEPEPKGLSSRSFGMTKRTRKIDEWRSGKKNW